MGTGRFGAGGSGALGRAGSGSGVAKSTGTDTSATNKDLAGFFAWRIQGGKPDPGLARELTRDKFAERNVASYVFNVVTSDPVQGCYNELVRLAGLLRKEQGWKPIEDAYGIKDSPGCLAELLNLFETKHAASTIEAHRDIAAGAVLDIVSTMVAGDDDILLEADAKTVLRVLDQSVLASLSGHYLGSVLYRTLVRDIRTLNEREGPVVRDAAQERADFIVAKFEDQLKQDGTGYRDFLRAIEKNREWFEDRLRQVIE